MRRVANSLLGVVLLATLLAAPSSALAEKTIALSTGTFDLALASGQSAADGLRVANNGDEGLTALVYTADIDVDEEGNQTYTRPEVTPDNYLSSPASWIRLKVPDSTKIVANTPYLDMQPGDELPVEFELVVPQNATPGDYNAAIFFEMFEFDEGSEGAVSRVSGRIGARIDLRVVGDIVDDVRLSDLSARAIVIGDTTPFSVRVTNEGNIDKKIDVGLMLLGAGETEEWSKTLDEGANLYAQRDRFYDGAVTFDEVGFGRYTFRAVMDYEKESGDAEGSRIPETVTVERDVWIIPLWMAIAAAVILGVPLVYVTYRVSTRGARGRKAGRATRAGSPRSRRAPADESRSSDDDVRTPPNSTPETAGSTGPAEDQEGLWAPESLFEDEGS